MFLRKKTEQKLWTFNYSIMTIGSVISLMGNYIVSFVLGILVLDNTGSVFLYGLYWAIYYAVKIFSPVLCGPIIDRLSKQKIIYTFDFLSAGLFLLMWIVLGRNELSFPLIYATAIYLGFSDCCYNVAFISLYPTLVKEEQLQKAYSIYSMLNTSAGIAVPIGTLLYSAFGIKYIFIASAILYFVAAVFETLPKLSAITENQTVQKVQSSVKEATKSFKEGFVYIKNNKALLLLAILVMVQMLAFYNDSTLLLPFCREKWENSYLWYIVISGAYSSGYFMGGLINSKINLLSKHRYNIFVILFFGIAITGGIYYFLPKAGMIIIQYLVGLMTSTLYTLRMATVQGALDEEFRGRYNGVETSLNNIGMVAGTFLSGCLAEFFAIQFVVLGGYVILAIVLVSIFLLGGQKIKLLFDA